MRGSIRVGVFISSLACLLIFATLPCVVQAQGSYKSSDISRVGSSSSKKKKAKPKAKPKAAAKPAAAAAKPTGSGAAVPTASKGRARINPGRGRGGVGGKGGAPKLHFPIAKALACLYFSPPDQYAKPGEVIGFDVIFSNQGKRNPQRFDFTVTYNPQWLIFASEDHETIAPLLQSEDSEMRVDLDQERGRIRFRGVFNEPYSHSRALISTLEFQAVDFEGKTHLGFERPPKGMSAFLSDGDNILAYPEQHLFGLIDANVFITQNKGVSGEPDLDAETSKTLDLETATAQDMDTPSEELGEWSRLPADANPLEPAWLFLQGPEDMQLEAGEEFWVDLALLNQSQVAIAALGVRLKFDPDVLEVLDSDKGNWITRGINAWDGAFHESYPFDFHVVNDANNHRGTVAYKMSRHYGAWPFPTGVFARLRFRARVETAATEITMIRSGPGKSSGSYLKAWGYDRLDMSWDVENPPSLSLEIVPAMDLADVEE